jgi:cell division protein ZapA
MRRTVEVEIMGQRLTVTSDDEDVHVREVAGYVEERMRQLAGGVSATTMHLALVTALNIASEYRKLQCQQEEIRQTINRLTQRVLSELGR